MCENNFAALIFNENSHNNVRGCPEVLDACPRSLDDAKSVGFEDENGKD